MRVFHESQKFNQWWFKLLMFSVVLITFGSIILAYPEVEPSEMTTFFLGSISAIVITLLIPGLFFVVKLITKIDDAGVHYGFWPFQRTLRTAHWHEIEKCYVREYSPLREFGGWGYKYSMRGKGKVYNTKGNMGIQIVFKNNTKTLVGTQKPEEARRIIEKFTSKEIHP